jgi:hypothetical protein
VCETARRRSEHAKETVIALNPDRVGHRYPTYHYEVGREKIREYAAATGVHDEIYRSDPLEVPTSELLAPPTFATCFTIGGGAIFADPELGAHWNLVHGSQEFVFARPIRGGDLLACSPWIVGITDRDRFEMMTYQIDVTDARTGDEVMESRATIIFFKSQEG